MIKKILTLGLAIFAGSTLFAQTAIPGGDFETWDSTFWQEPAFYSTSNGGNNLPIGAPPNVVQAAAYHGKYGIQLTTIKQGPDTSFAYFTNSTGNPVQGQGGIPYNQKATGVRFYYKCSTIANKDTAGVMFVFKKAGSVIGVYEYKLVGNVSSYTLYSKTFSPALSVAPDSVIIAAISSIGALQGTSCYPGNSLTLDSLTYTGVASQPAMQNGDFENWIQDSLYNPAGWIVISTANPRTTDKYTGKYALELRSGVSVNNGGQVQPGYATTGKELRINNHHDTLAGGYPYAKQIDSLIFYYKYAPAAPGDTAEVNLQFNKNAKVIYNTGTYISNPEATYTRMSVPFNVGSVPDSVIIGFESSRQDNNGNVNAAYNGTVLKIDSLHFASQPITVGIMPIIVAEGIKVYPNPSDGKFSVAITNYELGITNVEVYNILGKQVCSQFTINHSPFTIDLSSMPAGVYSLKITTGKGVQYQKLIKAQ